jgi:Domain of unknown function (DUF3482)/50S ribosome-binding GTPase
VSEVPTFAVVGHPNKGKSSIVATLAEDDSVRIAPEPGTTTACRRYPMKVDGHVQYVLVDTPGFQRARRAFAWMLERETTAAAHRAVVEAFVREHRGTGRFDDECELLGPLLEGAGILYVVDGSRPYGPEYEAEMEILRWTGQPSMALINLIGEEDHVEPWRAALGQYFRIVRVFDALTAPFEKRLELLLAFGELREDWREPLRGAVAALRAERARHHERVARAIAEMLVEMLGHEETRRLSADADPRLHEATLEQRYKDALRARERAGRREVELVYAHHGIERSERDVELPGPDLFSTDHWFFWGLNRRQLVATGAAGGALLGGVVDASVGGASLLLGSAIGAALGGATAWLSSGRIARIRVLSLPLGGRLLRCGPSRNVNLPYVVLGRALAHHALVAGRSHASRGPLDPAAGEDAPNWVDRLAPSQRSGLERLFRRLRDGDAGAEVEDELTALLVPLVAEADPGPGPPGGRRP